MHIPLQAPPVRRHAGTAHYDAGRIVSSNIACTICRTACNALGGLARQLCLEACNRTVC